MGSSISAIYDDYDEYQDLCKSLDIETKHIYDFYSHQEEILNNLGFKHVREYWLELAYRKKREDKINSVINK